MKLIFFFIIPFTACNLSAVDTKKTGLYKCSQSIEESKSNGVFRNSVQVDKSIIHIGDNKTDTIKQIWVEDMWQYVDENGDIKIQKDSTQQLLIKLSKLSKKYHDNILLKHHNDKYFGWNGVLFETYSKGTDTIYVESNQNNKENIWDTLIVKQ
ncbi:MAG: hypothetical protein KGO81_14385 [Bacteroidota bacterium]|nr:hypothetical protein [Bacteroidota bacterium]